MPALFLRTLVEFSGKPLLFFFSEKMKIRNFQIENKLSKIEIKIQMPLFRQLSFGVLNPLAYIVVITLIRIIMWLSDCQGIQIYSIKRPEDMDLQQLFIKASLNDQWI